MNEKRRMPLDAPLCEITRGEGALIFALAKVVGVPADFKEIPSAARLVKFLEKLKEAEQKWLAKHPE